MAKGSLMEIPRHVAVFLSSPGDVAEERKIARSIIQEELPVSAFLRGRVTLDAISWDDPNARIPTPAHLTPQQAIDLGLKRPSECDIVVVILWSRMGTPLLHNYKKPDGEPYLSGTEWEFEDAMRSARSTGRPTVLVYRLTQTPQFPITLSEEELRERRTQWERVERFFSQFRIKDGSLTGGTHTYSSLEDFHRVLTQHLQATIKSLIDKNGQSDGLHRDTVAEEEILAYRQKLKEQRTSAWRLPSSCLVESASGALRSNSHYQCPAPRVRPQVNGLRLRSMAGIGTKRR